VQLDVHFGIDPRDVAQTFIREADGPLFACTIVSESHVELLLAQEAVVCETFAFQVARGAILTQASVVAAFESWIGRTFPDLSLPSVVLTQWVNEPEYLLTCNAVHFPSPERSMRELLAGVSAVVLHQWLLNEGWSTVETATTTLFPHLQHVLEGEQNVWARARFTWQETHLPVLGLSVLAQPTPNAPPQMLELTLPPAHRGHA
jgi:hypothetical protein